ncbi:hypothetical protein H4S00_001447 [Coemansia sp. D1744]|nr:hypothetical protein J3F82_001802 [Coemansia sp. RSA 637]KAJ2727646.1 hypothetical protein H4S00_001447 [Coemansia sp. D1744]
MTSTVTKLGNEFAQMTEIDVANTMRLEYKTLNSMFRVWTYPFPDNGSAQVISAAILILVSLCPSLYNIRLFKRHKSVVDHVFRNLVSPRLYADLKKTIVPAIKPTLQDSRNYSSIIIGR